MISDLIETMLSKDLMAAIMDKNKKAERQLKNLTPITKDWVLKRYMKQLND